MKHLLISLLLLTACDSGGLKTLTKNSIEDGLGCKVRAKVASSESSSPLLNEYETSGKKVLFKNKSKVLSSSNVLDAGFELSVLIDRECVQEKSIHQLTDLTKDIKKSILVRTNKSFSKEEAYTVKLKDSLSFSTLEELADLDECVVGVTQETYMKPQATPNDPLFNNQTHLKTINYPQVFDSVFSGAGKISGEYLVAVLDTGYVLDHPDLMANFWKNNSETPGNGIDDDGNGIVDDYDGANFSYEPPRGQVNSYNYASHGTHVAGLFGAVTNNGVGVTGVMGPNIKIMPISMWPTFVGPGGDGDYAPMSKLDRGIRYAADMGAKILNISMKGEELNPNIQAALVYAVNKGATVLVAASNDAKEVGVGSYHPIPSYYAKDIDGVMAVAATDSAKGGVGILCDFSSYSTTHVEIAAPGCDYDIFTNYGGKGILSTVPTSTESTGYGYIQGTSMASPVAAGVAAYVYALLKERTTQNVTPALVEDVIKKGSSVNANLIGKTMGGKQVDMLSIYNYIQNTYVNPQPNPPENPEEPCP